MDVKERRKKEKEMDKRERNKERGSKNALFYFTLCYFCA
jgi:hypothetical protein